MSVNEIDQSAVATKAPVGRRSLLTKAAVAAAGVAAVGMFSPAKSLAVSPALNFGNIPGTGDVKVLNYALALEDLESDLYTQAYHRLTKGGVNALGITVPGLNLSTSSPAVQYVHEFGLVEDEHRNFLRGALGAAGIKPFKYNFNMQNLSLKQVLDLLYTAESTGTGAYLGAIQYFATKTYLQIAGAIQGTEARHTAVIAEIINILFSEGLNVAPVTKQYGGNNGIEVPLPPNTVLKAVSPFIVV